jgi:hypothetical protein
MSTKSTPRGFRLDATALEQLHDLAAFLLANPDLVPPRSGPKQGLSDALRYAIRTAHARDCKPRRRSEQD